MKRTITNFLGFIIIGIIGMSCSQDLPTANNQQSSNKTSVKKSESQLIVIAIISMSPEELPTQKLVNFDVYNHLTGALIGHSTGTDLEVELQTLPSTIRVQKGNLVGVGTITSAGSYTIYATNGGPL